MKHEQITAESIHQKMLQHVAPLPSQAAYARNLASIFSMHVHRNELIDDGLSPDELPAPSAIVVAPTGQGKTFLVRKMAECLDLNVIAIDCSTMAAEGWKGISLSERLATLKEVLKDDEKFARSVLFFDEVDKIRVSDENDRRGNPMVNLLQMFNGNKVAIEQNRNVELIDPGRFTVLFGGAFDGLEEIIRERLCPKRKIGFSDDNVNEELTTAELMQAATAEDLKKFGVMPELLGRIGTILTIPPLQVEDYRQLLNAETGSLRKRYNNYLSKLYGVSFEIAENGVEALAQKCMGSQSGARAVNPIVNDIMRHAVSAVESNSTICKVILDADEDGCCAIYEHGTRSYAFRNPVQAEEQKDLPSVVIKAKNLPALVRKLCRYYRNASEDIIFVPQLEAFLDCTLTYLFTCCRPSERTFESLEKLARVVRRPAGKNAKSPFDIIMEDAHKDISFTQRNNFDKAYTPSMQMRLVSALELIAIYIESKNTRGRVVFEMPQK